MQTQVTFSNDTWVPVILNHNSFLQAFIPCYLYHFSKFITNLSTTLLLIKKRKKIFFFFFLVSTYEVVKDILNGMQVLCKAHSTT